MELGRQERRFEKQSFFINKMGEKPPLFEANILSKEFKRRLLYWYLGASPIP